MLQKLDSNGLKTAAQDYMKRPRKWLTLATLLVAAVFVLTGYFFFNTRGGTSATLRTEEVARGNIERTVSAVATIKPKTFVDVGTQVSGQLRKVHVEIGDVVEAKKLI